MTPVYGSIQQVIRVQKLVGLPPPHSNYSILVEIAEQNMTLGHFEKNVATVFAPLMDNVALNLKFYG